MTNFVDLFRTGNSPTTYALLGHSSSYYGTAPQSSTAPITHHSQTTPVVGPVSTHSSVYQSIVYPHSHQYHSAAIQHNSSETRTSLYASQSPHHQSSSSIYRLPSSGVDHRHSMQQHDGYLDPLHSASANGGATTEIGGTLHGLTGSSPDDDPIHNTTNGSVSPDNDAGDNLGRSQPSTDPATVWRPY